MAAVPSIPISGVSLRPLEASPSPAQNRHAEAAPDWWRNDGPGGEADVSPGPASPQKPNDTTQTWGADGFGLGDLVDIINPLQHIPVISTMYRAITGDQIAAAPQALGSALFGGPIGLVAALVDQMVMAETGKDTASLALASLFGKETVETTAATEAPGPAQAGSRTANAAQPSPPTLPSPPTFAHQTPLLLPNGRPIDRSIFAVRTDPPRAAPASGKGEAVQTAETKLALPTKDVTGHTVEDWMLQALEKYQRLRQAPS